MKDSGQIWEQIEGVPAVRRQSAWSYDHREQGELVAVMLWGELGLGLGNWLWRPWTWIGIER